MPEAFERYFSQLRQNVVCVFLTRDRSMLQPPHGRRTTPTGDRDVCPPHPLGLPPDHPFRHLRCPDHRHLDQPCRARPGHGGRHGAGPGGSRLGRDRGLPSLHENGSSALALSSGWSTTKTTTASGGSFSTLVGRSGYASMTFKATGVAWISRPGPYNGLAKIYLDDKLVKTYDGYASKTQFKKTVWSVSGLSDSTHTLKIVRTGDKSASAKGANLVVDALRVLDVTAPSAPTSVKATAVRSGYTLSWARPSAGDLNGYRLYRKAGSGSSTQIAWLAAGTTSFRDVGLADATGYTYWVKAVDQTGNASASSAAVVVKTAAQPSYASVRYSACPSATTTVSTWKQLQSALGAAKAGTVIRMNPARTPSRGA